jgi:hypothetical protein
MWHLHVVQCRTLEWQEVTKLLSLSHPKHQEEDDSYMGYIYQEYCEMESNYNEEEMRYSCWLKQAFCNTTPYGICCSKMYVHTYINKEQYIFTYS